MADYDFPCHHDYDYQQTTVVSALNMILRNPSPSWLQGITPNYSLLWNVLWFETFDRDIVLTGHYSRTVPLKQRFSG